MIFNRSDVIRALPGSLEDGSEADKETSLGGHVAWAQLWAASLPLERRAEVEPGCKACPASSPGSPLRASGGVTNTAASGAFGSSQGIRLHWYP